MKPCNICIRKSARTSSARKRVQILTTFILCIATFILPSSSALAAGDPVMILETATYYTSLEAAIVAANAAFPATIHTIKVLDDLTESNPIQITSEITIIGAEKASTVLLPSNKLTVRSGGKLTLGDGTTSFPLTFSCNGVDVSDGSVALNDGVTIIGGAQALCLSGADGPTSGHINGGKLEATIALTVTDGAHLDKISGGTLRGSDSALLARGIGTTIGAISGGSFYKTGNSTAATVCVENGATLRLISGGEFDVGNPGASASIRLLVQRSGWIDEISGGSFETLNASHGYGTGHGLRVFTDSGPQVTGVGVISGGSFVGGAYALWVYGDGSQIREISGGSFEGGRALQVDVKGLVDTITGGNLAGSIYGICNIGRINSISGNVTVTSTMLYAVFNLNDNLVRGYIGEITGGTYFGEQYGLFNYGTIHEIGGTASIIGRTTHGIANAYGSIIDLFSGNATIRGGHTGIVNFGIISTIDGGCFIGSQYAINCTGAGSGQLGVIAGGVFYSEINPALRLAYNLLLEPTISTNCGEGRFWGASGQAFFNESLVSYPAGYYMSSATLPNAAVPGAEFKYLTNGLTDILTVTFDATGGVFADGTLFALSTTEFPLQTVVSNIPQAPERDGYAFVGWTINADGSGDAFTETSLVESDITVFAQWVQTTGSGGSGNGGTGGPGTGGGTGGSGGSGAGSGGLGSVASGAGGGSGGSGNPGRSGSSTPATGDPVARCLLLVLALGLILVRRKP